MIELAEDIPMFDVHQSTITHRNPKVITDGIVLYREATIEIDTTNMRQDFLLHLMHYLGEGKIRVKVARMKEQSK
jgi:hypothetical protein